MVRILPRAGDLLGTDVGGVLISDFKATNWTAILETIPTQLALVFFALLHVPINVPALALSVGEDNVETDKELINHGLSNLLAGCVGTIPNYLVYTNSVLFYRVGGTTRLSSYMLAAATLAVFLIGPWIIGYLPVMIVGTVSRHPIIHIHSAWQLSDRPFVSAYLHPRV